MKLIKSILVVALLFALNSVTAQTLVSKCKEMKDYQALLTKTFQPAETGNFEPIKASAADLLAKAEAIKLELVPSEIRNPLFDETLTLMKRKTKALNLLVVNKAPNVEIMRAFQDLYDVYNRVLKMSDKK